MNVTLERWGKFSKRDQWVHIAADIFRAGHAAARGEDYKPMLEMALELIDLSIGDMQRREDVATLLIIRECIADLYQKNATHKELEALYAAF